MERLFLVRALMFQAISGGYSAPKSLIKVAAEFDISPADAKKACSWLAENGFVERVKMDPDPKAPRYIEYAWHYKPTKYGALQPRMALFIADLQKGAGFGWELNQ
jgi:predicted transcriptional regulator